MWQLTGFVLAQLIWPSLVVTAPWPVPDVWTERSAYCRLKLPVTLFACDMVTEQVPVPEQAPLQPVKVEPLIALAVRVTAVLAAKAALHAVPFCPQVIPVGLEVMVPAPAPPFVTVSVGSELLKVAVTLCACDMLTEQVPVPEQAPLQPAKVEPLAAAAVRVTAVPLA